MRPAVNARDAGRPNHEHHPTGETSTSDTGTLTALVGAMTLTGPARPVPPTVGAGRADA